MKEYRVKTVEKIDLIKVNVPGSKSITNRALMLAALSDKKCILKGVLFSDDSRAFIDCLIKLEFSLDVDEENRKVTIQGENGKIPNNNVTINVRSAGTAARFITVMLAVCNGTYTLDSSEQMKKRPMKELLDNLIAHGVSIEYLENPGHFPFKLKSKGLVGNDIEIDTTTSSQYASALLMAASVNGLNITLTGKRTEGAYIKITKTMLEQFGIKYKQDGNTYFFNKSNYGIETYDVEPDMSAACYFYGMAMILKTKAIVKGIHLNSMQGDLKFILQLEKMGAKLEDTKDGIIIDASHITEYSGVDIDMSDYSDQALTMAVVVAFANSQSYIRNVGHIRGQESDRVMVIANELSKLGCKTDILEGKTVDIHIVPGQLHGARIETYEDHRVAMSFAMAGLKIKDVIIENPLCCKKTFENYFDVLDTITK